MVRSLTSPISVNLNPFPHVKKDYGNVFLPERLSISADQVLHDNHEAISRVFNQIHSEIFKIMQTADNLNDQQRNDVIKNFKNYFLALGDVAQGIRSRTFDLSVNNSKYFVHLDDKYDFKSVAIKNKNNKLIYQVVLEAYEDNKYQLTLLNPKQAKRIIIKGYSWDDDLWWLHNPGSSSEFS